VGTLVAGLGWSSLGDSLVSGLGTEVSGEGGTLGLHCAGVGILGSDTQVSDQVGNLEFGQEDILGSDLEDSQVSDQEGNLESDQEGNLVSDQVDIQECDQVDSQESVQVDKLVSGLDDSLVDSQVFDQERSQVSDQVDTLEYAEVDSQVSGPEDTAQGCALVDTGLVSRRLGTVLGSEVSGILLVSGQGEDSQVYGLGRLEYALVSAGGRQVSGQ
jgi:hypothetical protein